MPHGSPNALRLLTRSESYAELRNWIAIYLDDLAVRNRTDKTIRYYQQNLDMMVRYAEQNAWPQEVTGIAAVHIKAYIRFLQTSTSRWDRNHTQSQRLLSDNSVHAHCRAMRAFFNWLAEQGELPSSPMLSIRMPKVGQLVTPTFTESQINSLLACCRQDKRNGIRNEAIVLTLLDTGIREIELCQLQLSDIAEGRAKVMGKGRKERYVNLGKRAMRAIRLYVAKERADSNTQHIFLSESGSPLATDRLTHLVEQLGQKAGISGVRCSPHTFRHTFAIACLRSGQWTIYELLRALGHSPKSLNVLQRYLSSLNDDDVAKAHAKFSPADGMKLKK